MEGFFSLLRLGTRMVETTLRGYSASPTDPKRRTRPHSPLRGLTFLEQAAFLTGSSRGLRLRLFTDAPPCVYPASTRRKPAHWETIAQINVQPEMMVQPQRKAETGILFLPAIWTSVKRRAPSEVCTSRFLRPSHSIVPGFWMGASVTGWAA